MLIPSMAQVTGKVARSRVHVVLLDSTRVGDSEILTLASQIASKVIVVILADEKRVALLDGCIMSGFMTLLAPLRRTETHAVLTAAMKTCVANRHSSDVVSELRSLYTKEKKTARGRADASWGLGRTATCTRRAIT